MDKNVPMGVGKGNTCPPYTESAKYAYKVTSQYGNDIRVSLEAWKLRDEQWQKDQNQM